MKICVYSYKVLRTHVCVTLSPKQVVPETRKNDPCQQNKKRTCFESITENCHFKATNIVYLCKTIGSALSDITKISRKSVVQGRLSPITGTSFEQVPVVGSLQIVQTPYQQRPL